MDPSQMYEGSGHSPWFWVVYLVVAVIMTGVLMGSLIIGISRSYTTPSRKTRAESPGGTAPSSRRRHLSWHAHHPA